jgi:Transposase DDE domain
MLHHDALGQASHFLQNPIHLALVGDGFSQPGKLLRRKCQAGGFLPGVLPRPLVTAARRAFGTRKYAALADKADARQGAGQATVLGLQLGKIFLHGREFNMEVKLRAVYIRPMDTPFFPSWRGRLAAFGQRVRSLRVQPLPHLEKLFSPILPAGLLAQAESGANSRERFYPLRCTFWGFLWQALNPGAPCREAARQIQALFGSASQAGPVDKEGSAYCTARKRLPLPILQRARAAAAAHAEKLLPPDQQLWRGWRPKVVDGSTLSLADTPANQRTYPQSQSQKPGCGFPLLKLTGLFSLGSGALLGYAKGNKHLAELPLLFRLRQLLQPGDLLLGDRGFCSYVLMALLEMMGVACLFRLHQARPHDLRGGIRLGRNDRLVVWHKPAQKPRYLPKALWRRVPEELTVRVLRVQTRLPGFRTKTVTLVTTLSDAQDYPADELAGLYLRRWGIELWWRHLKISLGMEVLRCHSPAMIHKELEMYLIGYNLIRCLMAEAAALYGQRVERLSFKGSVDAVRQYSPLIAQARSAKKQRGLTEDLLRKLALDLVPERPGRREPRALKRRPKPYQWLTESRRIFQEISHRNSYRKTA